MRITRRTTSVIIPRRTIGVITPQGPKAKELGLKPYVPDPEKHLKLWERLFKAIGKEAPWVLSEKKETINQNDNI